MQRVSPPAARADRAAQQAVIARRARASRDMGSSARAKAMTGGMTPANVTAANGAVGAYFLIEPIRD